MKERSKWYKRPLVLLLCLCLMAGFAPVVGVQASNDASLGYSVVGIQPPFNNNVRCFPGNDTFRLAIQFGSPERATAEQMIADGYEATVTVNDNDSSFIIKNIRLRTSGNSAEISLSFIDRFVSTGAINLDWTITLLKDSQPVCSIDLIGRFMNYEQEVDATFDYVYTYDYPVVHVKEQINGVTLVVGNGVFINEDLDIGKIYACTSGWYRTDNLPTVEVSVFDAYPNLEYLIYLDQINLMAGSNKCNSVIIDQDTLGYNAPLYIYNQSLDYLGMTNENIPLSPKYYLSTSPFDIPADPHVPPIPDTTSSDNDSSSGSGSGGGGSDSTAGTGTNNTSSNVGNNGEVSRQAIATEASKALASSQGNTAALRTKNAKSISPSSLNSLADQASKSGKEIILYADTLSTNGAVQGRIYVEPQKLTGLKENLNLGAYTEGKDVNSIKSFFTKHFNNNIEVVHLTQSGSFGARLEIAAKINTSKLDTKNLIFYSFNKSTNTYTMISNPSFFIDANGYLHFFTEMAGDIIITDKILAR